MKWCIVAMLALTLVSCGEPEQLTYLGEIVDFTVHMGSFNTSDVSVVQVTDGNKYTVSTKYVQTGQHLYQDSRGCFRIGCCPPAE